MAQWLIQKTNSEAYRSGRMNGWKHPEVTPVLMEAVGGRQSLFEQAAALERDPLIGGAGKFKVNWRDMGADITKIDYDVAIIPELCKREGIVDPREQQQKMITIVNGWKEQVSEYEWIMQYYDGLIEKLENGKLVSEVEDEKLFEGLNAVVLQKEFIWERIFSAKVFYDSKAFKREYRKRLFTILKDYSPYYVEGMNEDELFAMHEIHSYAQTLECKGPLQYLIDNKIRVDSSVNIYGTVLNTQTMEHATPVALPGCKRIMTIENKANYENMVYREDTLYIYCHGQPSPKEIRFLKGLVEIVDSECTFHHWGDMDLGGITIFLSLQEKVFPKLMPYKMDELHFRAALKAGAGIELKAGTRKLLEAKDAGILCNLKKVILETNMTIEQEQVMKIKL